MGPEASVPAGAVHVIDDDDAARDSLLFLLETEGIAATGHPSADAFLDHLEDLEGLGCIVTDVRMPGMSGIELLQALRERGLLVPIIVITGHGDIALAVEAMKAGARDFLEKPYRDDALVAAVRTALAESRRDAGPGRDEGRAVAERTSACDRFAGLSPREREVLDGLVAGSSNKTIARQLGISPRTVEVYRANLMAKTQATSLSHLVRLALAAGVVAADPPA
jgi:two-component system response regulator FixJ